MQNVRFSALPDCEPTATQDRQHRLVLREHVRFKLQQALVAADLHEVP